MGDRSHFCFFINRLWDFNISNQPLFLSAFSDSPITAMAVVCFWSCIIIDRDSILHYLRKNSYEGIQF